MRQVSIAPKTNPPATPQVWQLSDRLDWAMGLSVSPLAKLVAVAIARRAGRFSGLCWPGTATIANDTGLHRTSVIRLMKELEQGGHLTVTRLKVDARRHAANRYRLPAMQSTSEAEPSSTERPPPSSTVRQEPVRTLEPVQEVQVRTVSTVSEKLTKFPLTLIHKKKSSRIRSSPQTAQQRMVASIAWKLGLHDLLTTSGLENFDLSTNAEKQILIQRLLRVEKRHDRRAAGKAKGGQQYRKKRQPTGSTLDPVQTLAEQGVDKKTVKPNRLRNNYSDRWQSALTVAGMGAPEPNKYDGLCGDDAD